MSNEEIKRFTSDTKTLIDDLTEAIGKSAAGDLDTSDATCILLNCRNFLHFYYLCVINNPRYRSLFKEGENNGT